MTRPTHIDDHAFIQSFNKQIESQPELSAAAADWQQIVGMAREASVRSHRLAAMVMHDYQVTRHPFALYLRSFESEAYEYVDKPGADGNPTTMWTTQHGSTRFEKKFVSAIDGRLPLLAIANPSQLAAVAIPRLQLPNDGWQAVARNLIDHAAFIVMECDSLAPGVVWELDELRAAGRQDATIIVVPPQGSGRADSGLSDVVAVLGANVTRRDVPAPHHPQLASFSRVIAEDAIDFEHLDAAPQFCDLLPGAIAAAVAAPAFDAATYARALNNEGVARFNERDYVAAMRLYDQALLVRRCIDDRAGILKTLLNIGAAFIDGGQPDDAIPFLTEAHEVAQELRRPQDEGSAAAYLGVAHKVSGRMPEAIKWLSEALPILEVASPDDVKDALVHLAVAYQTVGDLENARACAERLRAMGVL